MAASTAKRNVTVWRPSVCPVFYLTLIGRAAHTQGAARDAANVHFRPNITRTNILVKTRCRHNWT